MLGKISKDRLKERNRIKRSNLKGSNGVLHLGAHLAQEARYYAFHRKPVLWIEAIPGIYAQLCERLEEYPDQKALCALLGDSDGGSVQFHISNNGRGMSSSIYDFGEKGQGPDSLWPEANLHMVDTVSLEMRSLDTVLKEHNIHSADYDFWIVDLQGAELLALKGAEESLTSCQSLMVETSTVNVYNHGVLWPELSEWLVHEGFTAQWEPELQHDDVLFTR